MSTDNTDSPTAEATAEKQRLNLQVKVDETSTCKRHVTVTIPRDDIERYFQDAFNDLVPKAEVPGFRPGRAPRKLVEKQFREQMSTQVKGSLLMDSMTQVSEEGDFSAISEPEFDFEAVELPEEGPLTFEFDIEVRPQFVLPEWRGLKLTRPIHEYSDAEVRKHLNKLLAKYGKTTEKDVVAAEDVITVNLTFRDGETVLSEVKNETLTVRPKISFQDGNLDSFDQLVIGKKAGEKVEAKVTVGDGASREDLRGKEVTVEVEVVKVIHLELPELTPAFLDRIGGFESEEQVMDAVRGELERQMEYYQQRRVRQQITAELVKDANWDLPEDLLRRQYRREFERAVLELRASGFSEDDIRLYQNQLRQNSLRSTADALKEHFILERLAEDEKIEAEDSDYDAEIRSIARQSDDSPRRVRARLEKRGQMDALRNQIIERKAIDLITSHAEFSDVPFEPKGDDTVAIDHAISGHQEEEEIPEAKYGGEAQVLPGQEKKR